MIGLFKKLFFHCCLLIPLFHFCSCNSGPNEANAQNLTTEALTLLVDRPETLKILKISSLDSVFGKSFINPDEKTEIVQLIMRTNKLIMGNAKSIEDVDFSDSARSALMERQIEATDKIRPLLFSQNRSDGQFTGWKIKIEYEAVDESNRPYHSEYWFILDRNAKHILHSFEIPLV